MECSGSSNEANNGRRTWRAEEAIAGNTEALQALRELIAYPFLYSREAQLLRLQVYLSLCPLPLLPTLRALVSDEFVIFLMSPFSNLQWPRGLLLYGPPGTGKVANFQCCISLPLS